jgi:hypothetical protein
MKTGADIDKFNNELEREMTRRRRRSAQRKWFLASLVVVMLAVAAVLVFVKPNEGQDQESESPSESEPVTDAPSDTSSSSGRDITFEVTNLDGEEGSTGKFVVRTKPEWSPLGVEQFHVSQSRASYMRCDVTCTLYCTPISLRFLYFLEIGGCWLLQSVSLL